MSEDSTSNRYLVEIEHAQSMGDIMEIVYRLPTIEDAQHFLDAYAMLHGEDISKANIRTMVAFLNNNPGEYYPGVHAYLVKATQ